MKEIVLSGEINSLTAERVWKETEKALSTRDPQIYFEVLQQCGALPILFPKLVITTTSSNILKQAALLTTEHEIRFAVLCYKLTSEIAINKLCDKIKAPNTYRKAAIMVHKHCDSVHKIKQLDAAHILTLLNAIDVWRNPHHLEQLLISCHADSLEQEYPQADYLYLAYQVAHNVNVKSIIDQGFTGKDIHTELERLRIIALSSYI